MNYLVHTNVRIGSLAASWMATYGGSVAAGSALAVLQSVGMTWGIVAFPAVGAAVIAGAVAWGTPLNAAVQDGAVTAAVAVSGEMVRWGEVIKNGCRQMLEKKKSE